MKSGCNDNDNKVDRLRSIYTFNNTYYGQAKLSNQYVRYIETSKLIT